MEKKPRLSVCHWLEKQGQGFGMVSLCLEFTYTHPKYSLITQIASEDFSWVLLKTVTHPSHVSLNYSK